MTAAVEDFATIRSRITAIASERTPRCPTHNERTLHDCLRWSYEQCGSTCPHKGDWIGPEKAS